MHDFWLGILNWSGTHPHAWSLALLVLAAITFSAPLIRRKFGMRVMRTVLVTVVVLIWAKVLLIP
jgi:hypothetical protein